MRMPEQRLWDRMSKAITPYVFAERVENLVAVGTPDLHTQAKGMHTWIELKQQDKVPKRPNTPLLGPAKGLNPSQRNWHMEFNRFGGNSLIVVGVGTREIITIPGKFGDDVNLLSYNALKGLSVANCYDELIVILMGGAP